MYGGCDEETVYDEFNLFDIKTNTWYQVHAVNKFSKRENSTLTLVNNEIYLFGGQTEASQKKEKFFSDLYKLTLTLSLPSVQLKFKIVKKTYQQAPE